MENVYLGVATVAFLLSAGFLVACVVIFIKLHVLDAIRFMQHKPLTNGKTSSVPRYGGATKRKAQIGKMPRNTAPGKADAAKVACESAAVAENDGPADSEGATGLLKNFGSSGTQVFGEEDSENHTSVLSVETAESPTDMLVEEEAERPTTALCDSESSTSLLTNSKDYVEEASEHSERDTQMLVESESDESINEEFLIKENTKDSDGVFRFEIKQNIMQVHTDEVI